MIDPVRSELEALKKDLFRLRESIAKLLDQCDLCLQYQLKDDQVDMHCIVCGKLTCENCYELCFCEAMGGHCCLNCIDNHTCIDDGQGCY